MIIEVSYNNSILIYKIYPELDKNDILEYNNKQGKVIKLDKKICQIVLPTKLIILHNDLIALSIILLIYPFIGSRLKISCGVSKNFCFFFEKSGKKIEPIIDMHQIEKNNDCFPSISFSGRTNSAASLLLMPKSSKIIFLDTVQGIIETPLYIKDNMYFILDSLIADNYDVTCVKTDLEDLIKPNGFSFDLACCIPNILLSEYKNINNITFGHCQKSLKFINSDINQVCTGQNIFFENHIHSDYTFKFWDDLFLTVNIKLNFLIYGMTEIMSSYLVLKSKYKSIINSCMKCNDFKSCNKCLKCFKRNIISHIIENEFIDYKNLERYLNYFTEEVTKKYKVSIYNIYQIEELECLLLFVFSKYKDTKHHPLIDSIIINYSNHLKKSDYFFKINNSSFKYIEEKYQTIFLKSI